MTAARLFRRLPPLALLATLGALVLAGPTLAENKKAIEAAKAAGKAGDAGALGKAVAEIVGEGKAAAAKGLLAVAPEIPPAQAALYWQVLAALAALNDDKALDAVGDALIAAPDAPLSRDVIFAYQGNKSVEVIALYGRLLSDKKAAPLQENVVVRLGELERPEAVDALLVAYGREEKKGTPLERRIRSTLAGLFGEDMGDRANFEGWWKANREKLFAPRERAGGTGTVRDTLDKAREGGLQSMARGGRVLVLRGEVKNFDEVEKILEPLGVRHEAMLKTAFMADMEAALKGTAVVILNCNFSGNVCRCPTCVPGTDPNSRLPVCTGCDKHTNSTDRLSDAAIERLKRFVAQGGSVFTEDWGLKELVTRAWNEYLNAGRDLNEREVDYGPVPGQTGSPLLRGVFVGAAGAGTTTTVAEPRHWKVDNLSPSIRVVDAAKVTVLLASKDLVSNDNNTAVAVVFSPGEVIAAPEPNKRTRSGGAKPGPGSLAARPGLVLHVLSHFGKQKSETDEFTLQNLLVNFLLEAQERWREHAGAR
jgi:hypothetical protein